MFKFGSDRHIENIKKDFASRKIVHTTRQGVIEKIVCPSCEEGFLVYNANGKISCNNCSFKVTKDEYRDIANIGRWEGIVFDFSNNETDSLLHKVFDHHLHHATGNGYDTATSKVLTYFELIYGSNKDIKGLSLLRSFYEDLKHLIMCYDMELKNEVLRLRTFNLFINHLDMDALLSVFAFQNPNFALRNRDVLIDCSCHGDTLLPIREEHRAVYYTILGYSEALFLKDKFLDINAKYHLVPQEKIDVDILQKMKLLGKNGQLTLTQIYDIMLKKLRSIIENPKYYECYKKEILKDIAKEKKSLMRNGQVRVIPINGNNNLLVEYIKSNSETRIEAFYDLLFKFKKHKTDSFFTQISNVPLVIKVDKDYLSMNHKDYLGNTLKCFSIATNPHCNLFSRLDLRELGKLFEKEEDRILQEQLREVESVVINKENKKVGLKNFQATIEPYKSIYEVVKVAFLKDMTIARYGEILSSVCTSLETSGIYVDLKEKLDNTLKYWSGSRDIISTNSMLKNIIEDAYNVQSNVILVYFPQLNLQKLKFVNTLRKKILRQIDLNKEHKTWVVKQNMILREPLSVLYYKTILKIIRENIYDVLPALKELNQEDGVAA